MAADCATLKDLLITRATKSPDSVLYTFLSRQLAPEASWSYGRMHLFAETLAARILNSCEPSDRVILTFEHGPYFIASFFACIYAGAIAVPIQPPTTPQRLTRLENVLADTNARLVLTTSDILNQRSAREMTSQAEWHAVDIQPEESYSSFAMSSSPDRNSVAYLQYTSGSTSSPRGVIISHSNVLANLKAMHRDFHHSEDSVSVTWLPHFHDMGLVHGLLQPLYSHHECYVLAPTSFISRPACWLDTLTFYQGTHSGAPNFAYDHCVNRISEEAKQNIDLRHWEVALNGAEVVRQRTIERFARAFGTCGFDRASFYPGYGLAEATLAVSGKKREGKDRRMDFATGSLTDPVSCGQPVQGTEILIVDPLSRRAITDGTSGEIWVRGPGVALGYWNRASETKELFGAQLGDTDIHNDSEHNYLRTGDLGFLKGQELFISGRSKDLIIIRGQSHHPEDIEWTVNNAADYHSKHFSAAFSADFARMERLVVVLEMGTVSNEAFSHLAQLIRQRIAIEHGLQPYIVAVVRSIPKTSSGKVKRFECKRLYLEGNLKTQHFSRLSPITERESTTQTDSNDEILQFIICQVGTLLECDASPTRDLILSGLGLDSLHALELSHALQSRYQVKLAIPQILALSCTSIAKTIERAGSDLASMVRPQNEFEQDTLSHLAVSSEQERLWLLQSIYPESAAWNITMAIHLHGDVNIQALSSAVTQFQSKHAWLRAAFYYEGGQLQAHAAEQTSKLFEVLDLGEASSEDTLSKFANRPFVLSAEMPIRSLLARATENKWIFAVTVHHIVSDEWSVRLLMSQILVHYARSCGHTEQRTEPQKLYSNSNAADLASGESTFKCLEEHLSYWEDELRGSSFFLPIRLDHLRPPIRTHHAFEESVSFNASNRTQLQTLASSLGVTPFTIYLAAYALMLHELTTSSEILIATPYANRDDVNTRDKIGMYAYPIIIKSELQETFQSHHLIRRLYDKVRDAITHAVPLACIVERVHPWRVSSQQPLLQFFLGYYSEKITLPNIGNLTLTPYSVETSSTDFDLSLIIEEAPNHSTIKLRVPSDLFDATTAKTILRAYERIIGAIVEEPNVKLLTLFQEQPISNAAKIHNRVAVTVFSTFTASPLQEPFAFWLRELPLPVQIEVDPATDILRAFFGENDRELKNQSKRYIRIFLIRTEDWAHGTASTQQVAREFLALLREAVRLRPELNVVCLCPMTPATAKDNELSRDILQAEALLETELPRIPRVSVQRAKDIATLYSVDSLHDSTADRIASVPYTTDFYVAIATKLYRLLHAELRETAKAIVCDCDNTLWSGIIAEDGLDGIEVTKSNRALHKILIAHKHNGAVLCLCSKNEEEDISRAFASFAGLDLRKADFVSARINWSTKSSNLRSIARELQFTPTQLVYIDDDPAECEEVRINFPEILVIDLSKANSNSHFIEHYWALDFLSSGTSEAAARPAWYEQNKTRLDWIETLPDTSQYIESLRLKISSFPIMADQVERTVELMHRTTQFNSSGLKMSQVELSRAISSGKLLGYGFQLTDRFGDYGTIGILLLMKSNNELTIESMLLSCRALGKGVEHHMLAECGRIASENHLSLLSFKFVCTPRNGPAHKFLQAAIGGEESIDGEIFYRMRAHEALAIVPKYSLPVGETTLESPTSESRPGNLANADQRQKESSFERIASTLSSATSIVQAISGYSRPNALGKTTASRIAVADQVTEFFEEQLGKQIVSQNDGFFNLGGNSLMALRILSRIQDAFGVTLPLISFFQGAADVSSLTMAIERALGFHTRLSEEPAATLSVHPERV